MHDAIRPGLVVAAIVLASAAALVVDAPDLRINPVSGVIETVDATWSGSNFDVRYTGVMPDGAKAEWLLLTTNAANDLDPRIETTPTGDVTVVWWRDASVAKLVCRRRSFKTGVWEFEHFVGLATESNTRPRLIYAGDHLWMAYQVLNGKTRSVGVQIIDDDPEPIRSIIATTSYTGDLDIRIEAQSGHLWVSWIDSASLVGYSEFNVTTGSWSQPYRESYTDGMVVQARDRIRTRVLGL